MKYAIKVREVGRKKWQFLTSSGGVTNLRIHAARWATRGPCDKLIADNAAENPDWDFKVVDMEAGRTPKAELHDRRPPSWPKPRKERVAIAGEGESGWGGAKRGG